MRTLTAILAATLALSAQDGDQDAWEAFAPYEKAVRGISGVLEISMGRIRGERGILVRVQSTQAKDSVQFLLGDRVGGHPIHVFIGTVVAPAEKACLGCPLHCGGRATVAEAGKPAEVPKVDTTRLNDPTYVQERCDVVRKWLGLAKLDEGDLRCQEMASSTNSPQRIKWVIAQGIPHWRSQEMGTLRGSDAVGIPCQEHGLHSGGEMIAYTWVKHRRFCPLGAKQVLKEIEDQTPTQGPRR